MRGTLFAFANVFISELDQERSISGANCISDRDKQAGSNRGSIYGWFEVFLPGGTLPQKTETHMGLSAGQLVVLGHSPGLLPGLFWYYVYFSSPLSPFFSCLAPQVIFQEGLNATELFTGGF